MGIRGLRFRMSDDDENSADSEYLTDSGSDVEGYSRAEVPKDNISKLKSRLRRQQTTAPQNLGNSKQVFIDIYSENIDNLQNNIVGTKMRNFFMFKFQNMVLVGIIFNFECFLTGYAIPDENGDDLPPQQLKKLFFLDEEGKQKRCPVADASYKISEDFRMR